MARQTTKKKIETPEGRTENVQELIKHEHGIDALRAEIDRLNWEIRLKDLQIEVLRKENERLNKEQNK